LKTELTLLTHTHDPVSFAHVSGIYRSLYIVDWRMVVVEGRNVIRRVKGRGIVWAGECLGGYVQGECPYPGHEFTGLLTENSGARAY